MKKLYALLPILCVFFLNAFSTPFTNGIGKEAGTSSSTSQIRLNLYAYDAQGKAHVLDGTLTLFAPTYNNDVDVMDSRKLFNSGENVSMKRGNYDLIVEQRKSIDHADSIFFKIWGMQKQVYRLEFVAKNFHGVTAFLQDKYLHSSIPVNLNDTTRTDIQINTDPASYATDRFMIVFKAVGLEKIPFSFSSINSLPDNGNVKINWKTGNENQQGKYVIERSGDGFIFNDLVSINAFNLASNAYEWTDYNPLSGNNFYRIKSTDENGKAIYSKTLKVNGSVINPITVFPNPASVSNFNLKLVNQLPGTYQVQLLNSNARVFMSKKLENNSGNNLVKLDINQSVPRGVYHLVITDPSGEKQAIEVVF